MSTLTLFRCLLVGGALVPLATLTGCPDEKRRPVGGSCSAASQCVSGLCYGGQCLDPLADDDLDGLLNEVEAALGTDPFNADTDGDGVADLEEVGADNVGNPRDTDGDGKLDVNESSILDADSDCIVDQQDSDDAVPEVDPAVLGQKVCRTLGVCSASGVVITANCALLADGPRAACDYSQVPAYEGPEISCDGADNDCDGVVDNPFIAGGTVVYTEAGGTTGLVKGASCGLGACAGGTVVCDGVAALTCSSLGTASAELCDDIDNDCDADTDEGQDQADCTTYYVDRDMDDYGDETQSVCQCESPGATHVTVGMDCDDNLETFNPEAAGICGMDADCDTFPKDADEACDDANAVANDGCDACTVTPFRVNLPTTNTNEVALAGGGAETYVIAWIETDQTPVAGPALPFGALPTMNLVVERRRAGVVEPLASHREPIFTNGFVGSLQVVHRGAGRYAVVVVLTEFIFEFERYESKVVLFDFGGPDATAPVEALVAPDFLYDVVAVSLADGAVGITRTVVGDGKSPQRVQLRVVDGLNKVGSDIDLASDFSASYGQLTATSLADGTAVVGWVEGGGNFDVDQFQRITALGQPMGEPASVLALESGFVYGIALFRRPNGFWLVSEVNRPGEDFAELTAKRLSSTLTVVSSADLGPGGSTDGGIRVAVNASGALMAVYPDYSGQTTVIRYTIMRPDGTISQDDQVLPLFADADGNVPNPQAITGGSDWFALAVHSYSDGALSIQRLDADGGLLYR